MLLLNCIDWNEEDLVAELLRHYKFILVLQDIYGACVKCGGGLSTEENPLLLCDNTKCSPHGVHVMCCEPAIRTVPKGEWYCPLHPSGSKLRTEVLSTRFKQLIVIIYLAQ
jgi:hypothetical protein